MERLRERSGLTVEDMIAGVREERVAYHRERTRAFFAEGFGAPG